MAGLENCTECRKIFFVGATLVNIFRQLPGCSPMAGESENWLTQMIRCAVQKLNSLPFDAYPAEIVHNPSDRVLRRGAGDHHGADYEDAAASALVLLLLRPSLFGRGPEFLWWRLGYPPPVDLTVVEAAPWPRSSCGAGNRRGNLLEALLSHWETPGASGDDIGEAKTLLEQAWSRMRACLHHVCVCFQPVLGTSDDMVPRSSALPHWGLVQCALMMPDNAIQFSR